MQYIYQGPAGMGLGIGQMVGIPAETAFGPGFERAWFRPVENAQAQVAPDNPTVFYGDGAGGAGPGVAALGAPTALAPVVAAVAVITFAKVAAMFGRTAAVNMWRIIRPVAQVVGDTLRVRWALLPTWVQQLLIILGVTIGADVGFDTGEDDRGIIQIGGDRGIIQIGDDRGVAQMNGGALPAGVVGSWTANGIRFYRLSDGRLAVQNKRGRWKVWRPKRPIVLYGTGASNLKTFLRADAVLNNQAKRLGKALNRRAPRPRRVARGPQVIVEGGPGSVVTR